MILIAIIHNDLSGADSVTERAAKRSKALTNPLASHAGFHLRRVSSVIMADLAQRLSEIELRPSEASALLLIEANPGITQSKVARELGIQRANMAPLVAKLSERRLIVGAPVDGRSIGFRLTAAGQSLTAQARGRMEEHDARFTAHLSAEERRGLIAQLAAISEAAG